MSTEPPSEIVPMSDDEIDASEKDDAELADEFDDDSFLDCGLFRDGEVYVCTLVGTEECDFECPNHKQIGRRRWTSRKVRP